MRTYLLTYATQYSSIGMNELIEKFSMEQNDLHCVASEMIIHRDLRATWDQTTNSIIFHNSQPSRLQRACLGFVDNINCIVEANERQLDGVAGGFGGRLAGSEKINRSGRNANRNFSGTRGYGRGRGTGSYGARRAFSGRGRGGKFSSRFRGSRGGSRSGLRGRGRKRMMTVEGSGRSEQPEGPKVSGPVL